MIAKHLCLHRNKVSLSLAELREHRLVAVINPKAAFDRQYRITRLGSQLISLLRNNEKIRNL